MIETYTYTNDTDFSYQGIDYCFSNHSGYLLVTKEVVDEYNLNELSIDGFIIDSDDDEYYDEDEANKLKDEGWFMHIFIENVCPCKFPYPDNWDEFEEEATMVGNELPTHLLDDGRVSIESWGCG